MLVVPRADEAGPESRSVGAVSRSSGGAPSLSTNLFQDSANIKKGLNGYSDIISTVMNYHAVS